ncbi:MAG: type I-U CRISPR-associated protein Cas8c [Phycisphaerales bacterium]|nr:type I-U CRISPR-associated protein Cas8c [Phycisphaerales bacterium]
MDVYNPGQVFACMGFLEAIAHLCDDVEGKFEWHNEREHWFVVRTPGELNPFEVVLEFLSGARIVRLAPLRTHCKESYPEQSSSEEVKCPPNRAARQRNSWPKTEFTDTFPAPTADDKVLPVRLERHCKAIVLSHWCDGSSRNPFKLFAGQQKSYAIAEQMLGAIKELWNNHQKELAEDPFRYGASLGGSTYKLDPRKSWTTIDVGYSPDEQSHSVQASPIVELLGALGLEHARPDEYETRRVRYAIWNCFLPPALARAALGAALRGIPKRVFEFHLDLAGKNKVVTFSQEVNNP